MSFKAKLCLLATSTGARGEEDRDHCDQSVRCPLVFGARSLQKGHRGYVLGHLRSSVNGRIVVR